MIAVQIGGYLLVRVAPLVGAGLRNFSDVTAVADLELQLLRIDKAALDERTRLSNTLAPIRRADQAAVAPQVLVKIAAGTRQDLTKVGWCDADDLRTDPTAASANEQTDFDATTPDA